MWYPRVGEGQLSILKHREGTFIAILLEPRKRTKKALVAMVLAAYIQGVWICKVDDS